MLFRSKPGIIVALGGVALFALTGRSAIAKNRGKFLMLPEIIPIESYENNPTAKRSVYVVATYHPAAICYGSKENRLKIKNAMKDDFEMIHTWYNERTVPEVEIVKAKFW